MAVEQDNRNPARYLKDDAQRSSVRSLRDVYRDGSFYTMVNTADYHLDEVLAAGLSSYEDLKEDLRGKLLLTAPLAIDVDGGCSVFVARNKSGHVLVGRNYDFRHERSVLLLKTQVPGQKKTFGMANARFLDYKPGQLSDGVTDLSAAVLFPLLTVDGMNEDGVFISVLVVPHAGTKQHTGKKPVLSTVAMRAVLDRTKTVSEAVKLFSSYDLQIPGEHRDFHFLVADRTGDSAVLEYHGGTLSVIETNAVTNFYLDPSAGGMGEGKERYEVIRSLLEYRSGILERQDMMDILRLVSQPAGQKGKSDTLWSAVYDLTEGSMDLVVGHRYQEPIHVSL